MATTSARIALWLAGTAGAIALGLAGYAAFMTIDTAHDIATNPDDDLAGLGYVVAMAAGVAALIIGAFAVAGYRKRDNKFSGPLFSMIGLVLGLAGVWSISTAYLGNG
jgi:hypothetical protein